MAELIHTVGCDTCGYYVELESYEAARTFIDETRESDPFNCDHYGLGVVRRSKDLDFR